MSSPTDEPGFRRVHILTPLLKASSVVVAILVVGFANTGVKTITSLLDEFNVGSTIFWVVPAAAIAVVFTLFAMWLVSLLWWRVTGYRVTEEEIAFYWGLIIRNVRTARFDRVQAVDVVESFLPRLCGLAEVRVETAGGDDSAVQVGLLTRPEAEALRGHLLAVLGTPAQPPISTSDELSDGLSDADSLLVPTIPIQRSLAGATLSTQALVAAATLVVSLAVNFGAAALPLLIAVVPSVWQVVNQSWQFTAVDKGDVVVITYGLAERRSQTIKKNRIHGITVRQPLLWRIAGWWKVSVDVAGYGKVLGSKGTSTVLPVGSHEQVRQVLAQIAVLSDGELVEHADPTTAASATYRSPTQTRWCSPVDWRQHAVTLVLDDAGHPKAVTTRFGRFSRTLNLVATPHIQELTWTQGPLLRALGLATVSLNLVNGPVTMSGPELAAADAAELLAVLRTRQLPELTPPDEDEYAG